MFEKIKILLHQGKQYIPDVTNAEVPGIFRGRPIISLEKVDMNALIELCPTGAISQGGRISETYQGGTIDLGKCTFCGECAFAFPNKIKFAADYKIATNERERLIIKE